MNMKKLIAVAVVASSAIAAPSAYAEEFKIDRSVMSDAYWALWNDDVQRRIDANIEKYRKADAVADVDAPDGTEVKVVQMKHYFNFGAQFFFFNQLGKKEWNDRYKEVFGSLFNMATVVFMWRTLEPYPGAMRFAERYEDTEEFWNNCKNPKDQPHWRRPPPDPVIGYLKARACRVHGHMFVWGNDDWNMPSWLWDSYCPESEKFAIWQASGIRIPRRWDGKSPVGTKNARNSADYMKAWRKVYAKLSEEEIARLIPTYLKNQRELFEMRMRQIAERYGDLVDSWDVVNESATDFAAFGSKSVRGKPFDKSWYGPMPTDYVYNTFKWCQEHLPPNVLLNLNDYNMKSILPQFNDLVKNGARVDTLGTQMHIWGNNTVAAIAAGKGPRDFTPAGLDERFAMLAQAKRPILMSETTISAPERTPRGEMVQAIVARNLYRYWFSVECLAGITWWNLVDDCGPVGEPVNSGIGLLKALKSAAPTGTTGILPVENPSPI